MAYDPACLSPVWYQRQHLCPKWSCRGMDKACLRMQRVMDAHNSISVGPDLVIQLSSQSFDLLLVAQQKAALVLNLVALSLDFHLHLTAIRCYCL